VSGTHVGCPNCHGSGEWWSTVDQTYMTCFFPQDESGQRKWLWLHHRHSQLYGTDGEMRCADSRCINMSDYKRADLAALFEHVKGLR